LKTTAENFDVSTVASARALGIRLIELPRWNCCGTVHALAKDDVMHFLAPIRNLIRVEEMNEKGLVEGKKLVTQCAMCYNTLKRANIAAMEDQEKMKKIIDVMEKEPEYKGSVEVVHLIELLEDGGWEKVAGKAENPLAGLKVAPYYGCLLLRPRGYGIDDSDNPKVFELLLEALGAETVDIPFKAKCCGAYHVVHMKEVAAQLSYRILQQASEAGADLVATACPLCEYNLGPRQNGIKEIYQGFVSIPVVYYTQLMALAFGLGEEAAFFEGNSPDPRPVLKRKGLY
jgi:heterodisulfide reductase subunit B